MTRVASQRSAAGLAPERLTGLPAPATSDTDLANKITTLRGQLSETHASGL